MTHRACCRTHRELIVPFAEEMRERCRDIVGPQNVIPFPGRRFYVALVAGLLVSALIE